jgi:hypothetical protein
MSGNGTITRARMLDAVFGALKMSYDSSDFSDEEQACISKKIKKLRDEGKPQEEAVAQAIATCAPDKAKQRTDEPEIVGGNPEVPGGEYTAKENPDGTWNIQDVPVFCTHTRELPNGKKLTINRRWLDDALHASVKRFVEDQYLAPLHIQHHEFGKDVKRAGFFKMRSVKRATYEGKACWMAFADLVGVPPEIFARIRAGELPYRSVEILDARKRQIDSLALLDHEVPFFRLPNLTIGTEVQFKVAHRPERCADLLEPMLAYRAKDEDGVSILFDFGEETMSKFNIFAAEDKKEEVLAQDEEKKDEVVAQEEEETEDEEKVTVELTEDEEEQDDVTAQEDDAPGGDVDRDGLLEMVTQLGEGVKALASALGTEAPESDDVPQPVEMQAQAPKVIRKADETVGVYSEKSAIEIASLTGRVDSLEADKAEKSLVEKAKKELTRYGLADSLIEKRVKDALSYGGAKAVSVYIATVKENARVDPPSKFDGEVRGKTLTNMGLEATKYGALGPKALERAQFYANEYDTNSKMMKLSYSKDEYVADLLREEGFKVSDTEGK